jgi:hypothetical protein
MKKLLAHRQLAKGETLSALLIFISPRHATLESKPPILLGGDAFSVLHVCLASEMGYRDRFRCIDRRVSPSHLTQRGAEQIKAQ